MGAGEDGFEELADDFIFDAQEEGEDYEDEEGDMFDLTDCFGNAIKVCLCVLKSVLIGFVMIICTQLQRDDVEYDSDEYCSDISGEAYSDDDDGSVIVSSCSESVWLSGACVTGLQD